MLRIACNPTLKGLSVFCPKIVYSTQTGTDITLDLLMPQTPEEGQERTFPLLVFIQGSAWHFPDTNYEIPQLAAFAGSGYVVASVTHRNIEEGCPAPAFLQDVKTAIRFLRTHAAQYHIDPERVYAFGTSSGGNTALLLGLTGDMPEFRTAEYPGASDSVNAVIDCFGPADLCAVLELPESERRAETESLFTLFCGGTLDQDLLKKMSPIRYVTEGRSYVPFLIAHGDADPAVDFSQSARMVKRLEECGADVSFICVEGAVHEGNFWSQELLAIFKGFLDKQAGLK